MSPPPPRDLAVLPVRMAVCRLGPDEPVPAWAEGARPVSVTRTADELSLVVPEERVPAGVTATRGWRALRVQGTLDFGEVGILASLAAPLAEAGVPIFVLSTHDTDYVLVPGTRLPDAVAALRRSGHRVNGDDRPAAR